MLNSEGLNLWWEKCSSQENSLKQTLLTYHEEVMRDIRCGHIHFYKFIYVSYFRPKSGSTLLYSRKKVRYRRDGYCWKKRKDGKTTREDHMKLKVQGIEVSFKLLYSHRSYTLKNICIHSHL